MSTGNLRVDISKKKKKKSAMKKATKSDPGNYLTWVRNPVSWHAGGKKGVRVLSTVLKF
jgi:hypothetical protein